MMSEPNLAEQATRLLPKFRDFVGILEENVPVFTPLSLYIKDTRKLEYQLNFYNVPGSVRAAFIHSNVDITFVGFL